MPAIFLYAHIVHDDEIDQQGHANNIAYFGWMQQAAIEHSTAQGWSGEKYREHHWAWVVRTHYIEYRRPVFAGDELTIRTWVADMNRFTSLRKFEMLRDQKVVARAETNWAFVDTQQGKLVPIPEIVSGSFEIVSS
ncbi:acyl-CoA thioesterase [Planctomicrobium piriforme]|uniref:Acyl-CoA thioester hydrolase n=1 Tax=Planctomicrobium piriforme TaxID=1576369 RepID=A0A1I3B2Z3_9PLAN|nr:acyl-CoA thioesterase [Planctomicrobium piriforme]SFH56674.1 acyl-CoA thioester hydrolase [Planctomicrobium piriforme]